MADQKAIERRMGRLIGASEPARERLEGFNAQQTDWRGQCRVCGRERLGKLTDMECDHGQAS